MQTISILGCGWLGLPLAQKLVAVGYTVKGSTTTPTKISVLKNSNIIPYQLTLTPSVEGENVADFFRCDTLVVNIPFKRDLLDPHFYMAQIQSLIAPIVEASVKRVIFASSTLVYPALNQTANEDDHFIPSDDRARVLWDIERMLLDDPRFSTVILRFAGLYGPDREISHFIKPGRAAKAGNSPVNLVHLEDAIGVIEAVIIQNTVGEIFNVCGDGHPVRQELYTHAAIAKGLPPPEFDGSTDVCYKLIGNAKVKERLGYRFRYPSPFDWIR